MQKQKNAFTLMELMVVITIMAIVTIFTYAPYMLYKKKAGVNVVTKEIAQDLYLARSMAINGVSFGSGTENKNMSVGLYLEAGERKKVIFYGYTGSTDSFQISDFNNGIILKQNILENSVQINKISDDISKESSGALFYFSAITGKPQIYLKYNSGLKLNSGTGFTINLSYKGTSADILSKTISYNKSTFVMDY